MRTGGTPMTKRRHLGVGGYPADVGARTGRGRDTEGLVFVSVNAVNSRVKSMEKHQNNPLGLSCVSSIFSFTDFYFNASSMPPFQL